MIDVVAAMIYKENKFLIAKRNSRKSQGNLWEFPGGKVEPAESHQEALKREIKEELNAEIEIENYLGTCVHEYPDKTIKLTCYKAKLLSDAIELLEHEDYQWISREELEKFQFAEADKKIINFIKTN